MINSLHITNFQSHKESNLDFHPGVNVIIGESDSGKTAILRALKWVLTNRPGGDSFRSAWGGDTSVGVWTENSLIVREKIGATNNIYQLDGTVFKAFGADVPEEIQTALNMNEINIQNQLDAPFLLNDSSGQVASHFNKIAHLDSIDKSTQLIEKWTRALSQDIKHQENYLINRQEALLEYDHLPAMEEDIVTAEDLQQQYEDRQKEKESLKRIIYRLHSLTQEIDKAQPLLSLEQPVASALLLIQRIDEAEQKRKKLDYLKKRIQVTDHKILQFSKTIKNEKLVSSALETLQKIQRKQVEVRNLNKILEHRKERQQKIKLAELKEDKLQALFNKSMPNICPLCGQGVK